MADFKYNPARCSFKGWLRHLTDRRIADQFRKRAKNCEQLDPAPEAGGEAAALSWSERLAEPSAAPDEVWETEWRQNLLDAAIENVKRKVNPKHFRLFYRCVVENQPPSEVARTFEVNVALVYLAKHRIAALLKKEVKSLEAKMS